MEQSPPVPELPEVETVRRGLAPAMEGGRIERLELRRADLRFPFPNGLVQAVEGKRVTGVGRRAKYLLIDLEDGPRLVCHLGMSGSFRIESAEEHPRQAFFTMNGRRPPNTITSSSTSRTSTRPSPPQAGGGGPPPDPHRAREGLRHPPVIHHLDTLVASGRPRPRVAILLLAAAAVVAVAVLDYVTGIDLSLSVFYLLPVTVVTAAVSSRAGFGLAAMAAAAWTLAEGFIVHAHSVLLQVWNGILRLCILGVVVALLDALRRTVSESQASERRTKEFLTDAAHQLRTPVAGLQASAEALVMTTSTASRERLAENLVVEANRMAAWSSRSSA